MKNEKQLTEAEEVEKSISSVCKKYIAGSFFDKLVESSGIKIAKDILLEDLKEQIGSESAKLAEKFSNAVQSAKSTSAVDSVLADHLIKDDCNESEEKKITPFQQYLAEAREASKKASNEVITQDEIDEAIEVAKAHGYKVISEEEIEEAKTIAEKHGYKIITPAMIDEAKSVAEKNGYKVITEDEIKEAKKIVESKGFKVLEGKRLNESESEASYLYVPVYDYDVDELLDLIRFSVQNTDAPTFLRNKFGSVSFDADGSNVIIELLDSRDAAKSLRNLIDQYIEGNTGLEAEFDEDLLNCYPILLKKARIE